MSDKTAEKLTAGEKLAELGKREHHFLIRHVACGCWSAIYGHDGVLFPANEHAEEGFKTFDEAVDYLWDKGNAKQPEQDDNEV